MAGMHAAATLFCGGMVTVLPCDYYSSKERGRTRYLLVIVVLLRGGVK
ncbi:MAG: hypothetical protein LBH02_03905 [Methanocalculaceae archaeon]|nr:hypothetical protein [Methanocalculaceae archaeon]